MVKMGSRLNLQQLLSRASNNRTFIKDADIQIQMPASIETHAISATRTLKSVYPHFSESRKKNSPELRPQSAENLDHQALCCEMEEARQSYKKIKEIQEQLNLAYKNLMLSKQSK